MKLILSRKGFDSAAGGCPSPIIDGRPLSMPIPASGSSTTTYANLGLSKIVEQITRGRIAGDALCHHDPMFHQGECLLGQCGAAQSHLARHGVGPGDLFLFFGLFADPVTGERHHRIFGYLKVRSATPVATMPLAERAELGGDAAMIARFAEDRAREYEEFATRSQGLLDEIGKEVAAQKFTFAELEEIEDDLKKLENWLAKILARDFFTGEGLERARQQLATCREAVAGFAARVYEANGLSNEDGVTT